MILYTGFFFFMQKISIFSYYLLNSLGKPVVKVCIIIWVSSD